MSEHDHVVSRDEQEIVRGYVLFRPLYRPDITFKKTIPFIAGYLVLVAGIVFFYGWKIGLITGGAIVLVFMRKILITIIELYQHYAPEDVRRRCMLMPTCSEYGYLAIKKYGAFFGMLRILNRLFFRCQGDIYYIDNP